MEIKKFKNQKHNTESEGLENIFFSTHNTHSLEVKSLKNSLKKRKNAVKNKKEEIPQHYRQLRKFKK